tara:strand:+ start:776 stop:1081 length:306 start_codon:yes stop_codon:yes gene_type:complete
VKIPEKIKMGGHTITITRRELDKEKIDGTVGVFGYFDSAKLEIHIDCNSPQSLQWETYIHEILEAVCFFTETKLPHPTIQSFGLLLAQALTSLATSCDEVR